MRFFLFFLGLYSPFSKASDKPLAWLAEVGEKRFEVFCDELWSANNNGDLKFQIQGKTFEVNTALDQFSYTSSYIELLKRILVVKDQFPQDFKEELAKRHYFDKVASWLKGYSKEKQSLKTHLEMREALDHFQVEWEFAYKNVNATKVSKKYPHFRPSSWNPYPMDYEYKKEKRDFLANIFDMIWDQHPQTLKVKKRFEELKNLLLVSIDSWTNLPTDLKREWKKSIKTVSFMPLHSDYIIRDQLECLLDLDNAFYLPGEHSITICAGALFRDNLDMTILHELSHALGDNRRMTLIEMNGPFAKIQKEIKNACFPKKLKNRMTLNPSWFELKKTIEELPFEKKLIGDELPAYPIWNCLSSKSAKAPFDITILKERIKHKAENLAIDSAYDGNLSSLLQPELTFRSGEKYENVEFLNPCYILDTKNKHLYPNDIHTFYWFFIQEYLSIVKNPLKPEIDKAEAFMKAQKEAQRLYYHLITHSFSKASIFSGFKTLVSENFSQDVEEDFADLTAVITYSKILEQLATPLLREAKLFQAIAWYCPRRSLKAEDKQLNQVEHELSKKPHGLGIARFNKILIAPIRQLLNYPTAGAAGVSEVPDCSKHY